MKTLRLAWGVGIAVFGLMLFLGWALVRKHATELGFAEWSSIVHAALGLGFFLGFMSYIGMTIYRSGRGT